MVSNRSIAITSIQPDSKKNSKYWNFKSGLVNTEKISKDIKK